MCIIKFITFFKKYKKLFFDQYQKDNNFDCKDTDFDCKDTIFDYEDSYYYYDIDVDRILFFTSGNKHFIIYKHSNKMDIVPLQLKIKDFYYEIQNYGSGDNIICIENSDKGFFEKMKKKMESDYWIIKYK